VLLRVVANACAWAAIQLGLVAAANQIQAQRFRIRAGNWERRGRIYHSLGVRVWKDKLPDGGAWFSGGYSKRHLRGRSRAELDRFAREARRGELVHWCAIGALPLFALWNTRGGLLVNALYACAANLPCIIAQRYNRARIAGMTRSRSCSQLRDDICAK
jgi:glycosyl-4,4'-diaponeurosporenoate acyltransferase